VSPTPLERLALYFAARRTRQGILARAALGAPPPSDRDLARELAATMAAELRPDGSVGGVAVATIWRAHELLDLHRPPDDPAVRQVLAWLLERQGGPGAYGEGCDRVRHAQRVCEHWVQGFFAPAPPGQRLAPITLPNGKAFRAEPAARFGLSCLGLRAALRSGLGERPGVVHHLDSLRALAEQWTEWAGFFPPDVIVAGLHALALGGPGYRPSVQALVALLTSHQRLDGLWSNADPFATLEALIATDLPEARTLLRRAMPTLCERLRDDGTFGPMAQQERGLIAVRALVWVEGQPVRTGT
jgi:hypothetical protein